MEHESFVPVTAQRVTLALRTPALVAASLPGWQPDEAADGDPRGRLRLRVGGSTITYRGVVAVEGPGPTFTVVAEGTEVRGTGTVKVTAEVEVAAVQVPAAGTTLTWRGTADVDGRLASFEDAVAAAAVRRLLDRFSARLAENAPEVQEPAEAGPAAGVPEAGTPAEADPETESAADTESASAGQPAAAGETAPDAEATPDARTAPDENSAPGKQTPPGKRTPSGKRTPPGEQTSGEAAPAEEAAPGEESDVVDDLGEPAPSAELDDFELVEVEVEVPESAAALDDLVPPAEAAHARRTMIGRSAEEVDHAPPRGRYSPVPPPDSGTAAAALRWAAPAAAALVASAVVVGRVLRRRR